MTGAVSLALRTVFFNKLAVSHEQAVSALVVLGFALSLVGAAALTLSKRDTIILILTGAILWGAFVEKAGSLGLVRFILFSLTIGASFRISEKLKNSSRILLRLISATFTTGILCGLAAFVLGLLVQGRGLRLPIAEPRLSFIWGLLLGGSVGFGVSLGWEITQWLEKRAKS